MPVRVHVTLCFTTDTPPSAVAMAVGHVVTAQVADQMDSIHWQTFDLDDEQPDGS